MLYEAYQAQADALAPMRALATVGAGTFAAMPAGLKGTPELRRWQAVCELLSRLDLTHTRRPFGIDAVEVAGERVPVTERVVDGTPFGTLLRFAKATDVPQPRVLVVAPMSGHFATLLRATVRTLLADHEVLITDWHNARDVPRSAGAFGMDEYTEHLIRFLRACGPGTHVLAVCQPVVQALAASALMAEDGDAAVPASISLMAGPVDGRVNPTKVNELAQTHPLEWFERNVIASVPLRYRGALRRVYPGFLQVSSFMSMNAGRHMSAFERLYRNVAAGEFDASQRTRDFYEEYFTVSDLTAEFYLGTMRDVFQTFALARGEMRVGERRVDPRTIRSPLLTVEGELDDVCGEGQTQAAHGLCTGVAKRRRTHHRQAGVGHYGIFSGRRWEAHVYPVIRDFIAAAD